LLDAVRARFGRVPNVARALADSPATLGGWLGLSAGLDEGVLHPALREQIGLTVSQLNECGYGLAVHATVGKAVGLSSDEIVAARRATAADAKTDAALRFARALVEERGHVADAEIRALEAAGFGAGEIVEIIVLVAHEILINYTAIVRRTEVDFPAAEPLLDEATGTAPARG
jgi:AhpD family alkylhydroperoxidase